MEIERLPRFSVWGFFLSLLTAFIFLFTAFGYRFGAFDLKTAFLMLRVVAYSGIAASLLCLIAIVITRIRRVQHGLSLSIVGLALGLNIIVPLALKLRAVNIYPRIHDISTDTKNPPAFVIMVPLRKNASNPPEYGGPELARTQALAYPDIRTIHLRNDAGDAFDRAVRAAQAMGWQLVSADKGNNRIEGTDTSFWFGFKDDIVIRLQPTPNDANEILLDIRSVSRVGISDLGVNANRIRRYIKKLLTTT